MSSEVSSEVFNPSLTDEQIAYIKRWSVERHTLAAPSILVVEDQSFSRSLLEGMLKKNYDCHSAANAEQAIELYAEHVPCITFLDIELPDMNGHDLAAFIKKYDPGSFIVMVTANNYEKDVTRSRNNNVQGFIAKPFSRQKVMSYIDKYIFERKQKKDVKK